MTKEKIIRMAREAGVHTAHTELTLMRGIERFAALVAAHEREMCAKVAEDMCEYGKPFSAAAAIRARGEKE